MYRVRVVCLLIALILLAPLTHAILQNVPVHLWRGGAPGAKGTADHDSPQLLIFTVAEAERNGCAVIVAPGGGYRVLASDHEGSQVAIALNRLGITAFVLRYRLMPDYPPRVALQDAQRAVRWVRHNAAGYGINPDRIGMLGFSAGGHLTGAAGTAFDDGDPGATDPIERMSSRPDFLVPVYGALAPELLQLQQLPREEVLSWGSPHKNVTKNTPPAFLVHSHEDKLVSAKQSVLFYEALLEAGVPAEMHIFGRGSHGNGLAPGDDSFSKWVQLLDGWLRRSGFYTDRSRVSVTGNVSIDGQPLFWGHVVLRPVNDRLPAAIAYVGPGANGAFTIDQAHGPVTGEYQAEVYRVSTDFSNPRSGYSSLSVPESFMPQESIHIAGDGQTLEIIIDSARQRRWFQPGRDGQAMEIVIDSAE